MRKVCIITRDTAGRDRRGQSGGLVEVFQELLGRNQVSSGGPLEKKGTSSALGAINRA